MCPRKGDLATGVKAVKGVKGVRPVKAVAAVKAVKAVKAVAAVAFVAAVPGVALTSEQRAELVVYHKHWNAMKPRTEEQKAHNAKQERARVAKNKAEAEKANEAKKKAKK